jgi:hypothetical protein
MLCKYCHLKTHLIDKCPTIICKICRDIGHPQWLCTKKKEMNSKKNDDKNYKLDKKYSFNDELKKKDSHTSAVQVVEKNIEYYKKLRGELWSNLA